MMGDDGDDGDDDDHHLQQVFPAREKFSSRARWEGEQGSVSSAPSHPKTHEASGLGFRVLGSDESACR